MEIEKFHSLKLRTKYRRRGGTFYRIFVRVFNPAVNSSVIQTICEKMLRYNGGKIKEDKVKTTQRKREEREGENARKLN